MLVRVVDYVANPGGGVRFAAELLRELVHRTSASFEVVSSGPALATYRSILPGDDRIAYRDLPPMSPWRQRTVLQGVPGAGPLNWLLGTGRFHFEVSPAVYDGADVVWLPWLQRHRIPWRMAGRTLATLHDVIALDFPEVLPAIQRRDEARTIRRWLRSSARIVTSSRATVDRLTALFGVHRDRSDVVPLSGQHARPSSPRATAPWSFEGGRYLLAPINLTPHKNFEVLLAGVRRWGPPLPLVVTGSNTDIFRAVHPRARRLARSATSSGLVPGTNLFALGYVDDPTYYDLLDHAWAVVMPTLAEGGGSFPVWEALHSGVPVVCSDIPVMREMLERVGASVQWFDPTRPEALAAALADLDGSYAELKTAAVDQVATMQQRTWADVATDYARIMGLPSEDASAASSRADAIACPGGSARDLPA